MDNPPTSQNWRDRMTKQIQNQQESTAEQQIFRCHSKAIDSLYKSQEDLMHITHESKLASQAWSLVGDAIASLQESRKQFGCGV